MKGSHPNRLRAATVFIIALVCTALAGCSDGSPDTLVTSTLSTPATVSPSGSTTVDCDTARPEALDSPPPGADDLIIGPLVYPGLGNGWNFDNPPEPDADGVTFFKIGATMPSDSTVTVSIGKAAQSHAGILTEQGPSVGYSSVTYVGCSSATHPARVWWVGGFTLVGRDSACVPLDVQVKGENVARHLMLSIEAGACNE